MQIIHCLGLFVCSSRSEFIISSQCVSRAWVLASCKLPALILTCIYPMVSAMTSYSSLTSRRIFVSRHHSTESDFEFMKSCLFIVCKTRFTVGESQAISHANRTANTRTPNCQSSQGKIGHQKNLWSENADLKFNSAKMETAVTNSGAERTSLNEFRMLKYFKSKWKWFWITSLNIWANIAVTKHVLLADEFIPYRTRLLGFHALHGNAMKCIYVGFSLSKLQSFFWKRASGKAGNRNLESGIGTGMGTGRGTGTGNGNGTGTVMWRGTDTRTGTSFILNYFNSNSIYTKNKKTSLVSCSPPNLFILRQREGRKSRKLNK